MNEKSWPRMIALIDMDAFFAAIEQKDHSQLRNQPVAVTNGEQGATIISPSYEARRYGIHTGMSFYQASKLCPRLIRCPARPQRYAKISRAIMQSLHLFTPDIEIFSVDEAFLDLTRQQDFFASPLAIGERIKSTVFKIAGVTCSIGISGDKTTAKYAAKCSKPNGLTIIHPQDAKAVLAQVPVEKLCGISDGIKRFLNQRGVYVCQDMQKLPIGVLAKRFGPLGRRLWLMCQGLDPSTVQNTVKPPQSLSHSKVMPPFTTDRYVVTTYLLHMAEKVATRLRRHQLAAKHYWVGLRTHQHTWLENHFTFAIPANNSADIFKQIQNTLLKKWRGEPVKQVRLVALDPQPQNMQLDLFNTPDQQHQKLDAALDAINQRYGAFTVMPARLIDKAKTPNVISPAWQPEGLRESIDAD